MSQTQPPVGYYPQPVFLTDEQFQSINDSLTVIRQCVYVLAIFVVGAILLGVCAGLVAMLE